MEAQEASTVCDQDSRCSSDLPNVGVEKELNDECEERDEKSRLAEIQKRLVECEERARQAEEDRDTAADQVMEWIERAMDAERFQLLAEEKWQLEKAEITRTAAAELAEIKKKQLDVMEKYENALESSIENAKLMTESRAEKERLEKELERIKIDLDATRKELEESQMAQARLEDSLKKERKEREESKQKNDEGDRTKKRLANLAKENEDLRDRVKKLADRLDRQTKLERDERVQKDERREERRESERRMERLEKIRIELSRTVEESVIVHARMENERDEMKKALKETNEENFRLLTDVEHLRISNGRLKSMYEEVRERSIEAEEKERRSRTETEKNRAALARVEKNVEELRTINAFLVTTQAGELFEEVVEAKKRIEQLEGQIREMNLGGNMKDEEETKRKIARKEELEEGEIDDEPISPDRSSSKTSEVSSSASTSLWDKVTVARSISDKIAPSRAKNKHRNSVL